MRSVIRKTFPKIRIIEVKGSTFYQVDARKQGTSGRRETFSKRSDAEKRAVDIALDLAANGADGLALSLELRVMAEKCAKTLSTFGKSIHDATMFYVRHLEVELAKQDSARVVTLAEAWFTDKSSNKRRQLRRKSLNNIRDTANLLKRLFPNAKLMQVQRQEIEQYLDGLNISARSRFNTRNLLNQFFNWCIKNKYISLNPVVGIEIEVPSKDVIILSAEHCIQLMRHCEDKYQDLTLYHAICLFAGLRPTECKLLTWENVHLEEEQITVLGSTSKTKETRNVKIESNLLRWLEHFKGERKGLITRNANLVTRLKKFRADLGYKVLGRNAANDKWIEDIMRHSYASYWLAKYKDRAHLAENMGNSLKMIKQHYKRIVANSAHEIYWNIKPGFPEYGVTVNDDAVRVARFQRIGESLDD